MNEILTLKNDSRFPIDGRELHAKLGVETRYNDWFKRMCRYGFVENTDYETILKNEYRADGALMPKKSAHHALTISMAKEVCMIQRTEIGRQVRRYLIAVEEAWNSPEQIMARALRMADETIGKLTVQIKHLETDNAQLAKDNQLMAPKASYCDLVLQAKEAVPISLIAKDYGLSARTLNAMLHDMRIQYKVDDMWLLYQPLTKKGYTKSVTYLTDSGVLAMRTLWTQKGRMFLYEKLKEKGVLPEIEQTETGNLPKGVIPFDGRACPAH